ncbi:MAG: ATP-binding protein [Acidobacteria bacterium]|nr:MAG: ATP-binding protein [Acidobacteriota bacterium]
MKILVSWSSGKDSAWTLHVLREQGVGTPAALLTSVNETFGRVAMHAVRTGVLEAQAEAAGLPLLTIPLPWPCPNDVYEDRLRAAVGAAVTQGVTHIAFGDLFLRDVRRYREERLAATGLTPIFPLWDRPTDTLAREMIRGGLRARLTCVDPRVLPLSFAGRAFDDDFLRDLPSNIDPCGERGEFHTCVTDGPMFSHPVPVTGGEIVERDGFVFADLLAG